MKKKPRTQRLGASLFVNTNLFPGGAVAPLTMEIARRSIAQERRRTGAVRANVVKRQKSASAYAKYDAMWEALSPGRDYSGRRKLRLLIQKTMVKDGFVDPQSGGVPVYKTLLRRYPGK